MPFATLIGWPYDPVTGWGKPRLKLGYHYGGNTLEYPLVRLLRHQLQRNLVTFSGANSQSGIGVCLKDFVDSTT
jgi:hypothetical protein